MNKNWVLLKGDNSSTMYAAADCIARRNYSGALH